MSFEALRFEGKTRAWSAGGVGFYLCSVLRRVFRELYPSANGGFRWSSMATGAYFKAWSIGASLYNLYRIDTGYGLKQRSLGSRFSVVTSGGGGSRGVIDHLRVLETFRLGGGGDNNPLLLVCGDLEVCIARALKRLLGMVLDSLISLVRQARHRQ
ncbi:unnamed protein product [Eruca vesicaria subsp. sativa]|uniref:Uncharacterized protein n=1 Tax=Eruca vesicaria subsp. sativa TaxID=29727 RepID=A0ABC8JQD7_ERUVS|nr:unnamed protein product [Eruca vesicaria subsp. sativa]